MGPGTATEATHRCLRGGVIALGAYAVLWVGGVPHAQSLAIGIGFLSILPRIGPVLGVAAAAACGLVRAPLLAVVAAVVVGLVGLPARHLPRAFAALSPAAVCASVLLGGAVGALGGAVLALALTSLATAGIRRLRRR